MVERWVLFPFPKGGSVLRAPGHIGLLLMPSCPGCCGESVPCRPAFSATQTRSGETMTGSTSPQCVVVVVVVCAFVSLRLRKNVRILCWPRKITNTQNTCTKRLQSSHLMSKAVGNTLTNGRLVESSLLRNVSLDSDRWLWQNLQSWSGLSANYF